MRTLPFKHNIGVGLRTRHYPYLETRPETEVSWFEVISENYINSRGRPWEMLTMIRQDYPVALHGVSINLGCPQGLRVGYLAKLKELIERIEPFIVSDHICWTGSLENNLHDLLPLPATMESLKVVVENIDFAQNFLRHPLVLENIPTYIEFTNNDLSEAEFLSEISMQTGCGLRLDLNNVHVNATNYGFSAKKFIDKLPLEKVMQLHLGGPSQEEKFLFDTHSTDVPTEVWDLLRHVSRRLGHLPILIERDDNIPDFNELEMEVIKAAAILGSTYEVERSSAFV